MNPTHSATMCITSRSEWVAVSLSSSLAIRVFTSKKDSCYFFLQFNGLKRASATSLWYSLSPALARCGFPLFSPGSIEHLHLIEIDPESHAVSKRETQKNTGCCMTCQPSSSLHIIPALKAGPVPFECPTASEQRQGLRTCSWAELHAYQNKTILLPLAPSLPDLQFNG